MVSVIKLEEKQTFAFLKSFNVIFKVAHSGVFSGELFQHNYSFSTQGRTV